MKILEIKLIGFKRFLLNKIDNFDMVINNPMVVILGSNGSGKAQPLDSLIKVPNGWLTMGQMEIDTKVIAKDGSITKVNGVYPKGLKEIYKVTFADGRSTECCADHLWKAFYINTSIHKRWRIINTLEVMRLISLPNPRVYIDLIDSEQNEDIQLPLEPYLLGVFLGDGSSRGSPDITTPDIFIVNEVSKLLPIECELSPGYSCRINTKGDDNCFTYGIRKKPDYKINTFTKALKDINLFNKLSYDKFIPEEYLHASSTQRLHLLQGLLDTDGTICKGGTVSFTSSSEKLSIGVQYLVRSLGGIAKIVINTPHYTYLGQRLQGRLSYNVYIQYKKQSELFRLPKKKERTNDNNQYSPTLKLKIKSIELIGFKETQCISVEHSDHLYVTDQFIVTHNTSCLDQLTPLPPSNLDFVKTGIKHITISHNNSIYNLITTFNPSTKHQFIKDDVELNPGGSITIQKELVRTHFGITPETHSLSLGQEDFATMSPARRKEWFITLCDTNYDYAIKVYGKLKERSRDVSGALKLARKKLIHESEKLIKTDEEVKLREEVLSLHDQLNTLLEYRKPIESDLDVISFKQNELDNLLVKYTSNLAELIQLNGKYVSDEKCADQIEKLTEKITSSRVLISKYSNEYVKAQDKINILQKAKQETILSLQVKSDAMMEQMQPLISNLLFIDDSFDPVAAMNSFQSVKNTLSDIFSTIPLNQDKKYSSDKLNIAKEKLQELTKGKKIITEKLDTLLSKQKHMLAHRDNPDIDCPNCSHKFSLHYNEKQFSIVISNIQELEEALELKVNPELVNTQSYIDECVQYGILYRQYAQCVNNFAVLKPYWYYLNEKSVITNNPQSGVNELFIIENDLKNHLKYHTQLKLYNETISLLKSLEDVGSVDLDTLQSTSDKLQKDIETHTTILQNSLDEKKLVLATLSRNKEIQSLSTTVKNYMDKKYDLCKEEIETTRRSILNDTIKMMQSKLASKEHILTSIKTQKSIIENTVNSITELELQDTALTILVKQLSPTDGLIAQGLFGFIKGFINQMNKLIGKVWTYQMEIKPCELTNESNVELDYKFPIWLAHNTVSDVSKGSTGMIEMINLAFKIIALKFLGLQQAPLICDEIGRTLDASHKQAIVNLIKQLIEQHVFTQVFLVSHDFSQYSAMSNVDTCVLSTNNIILPEKYNTTVVMDGLN